MSQIKKVIVKKHFTDDEMKTKEGTFFDDSKCKIYRKNVDIYTESGELLIKFRKKVLNDTECEDLMDNKKAAVGGIRANASGIKKGQKKYIDYISKRTGKRVTVLNSKKVKSGMIGFYDNFSMFGSHNAKNSKQKCRMTGYTSKNKEKFEKCLPIFKKVDKLYKKLVPNKYRIQKTAIKGIDKNYVIKDTVFTTITVNNNFRTALHQDSGDFEEGMGNLLVVTDNDNFKGAYTLFPQYKVGIDLKNGDLAFMNVHEWHCNSEMFIPNDVTRLSFVFYLRKKMLRACLRRKSRSRS